MNSKFTRVVCLLAWAVVLCVTNQAQAQTTANGPYYANPAWDQTLACTTLATCPRFIVLSNMSSAAVLDRETGLVWDKSPGLSQFAWSNAQIHCNTLTVGNRRGWRLPTIQELASLVDGNLANTSSPRLPPGHPFTEPQAASIWSATTNATDSGIAWVVSFVDGSVGTLTKPHIVFVWCVRGGQGVDPQ